MVSSNKYLGKVQGKWVDKIPCTSCTSSDALVVYEKDGKHDATCFSCGHYEPNPPGYGDNQTFLTERSDEKELGSTVEGHRLGVSQHPPSTDQQVIEDFKTYPIRALPERGITQRICEKYGVRVSLSPQDGESTVTHKYPYYKDDKLTGYKERICATKAMWSKGDCTGAALFGSHCHKPNGKTLFITEGECFPDYAEILTPDGWVTFKEYSGQSVAQYTEAGSLRFVAPSAVIKKPYKGDLVKHSVKGYTSITTPDHNLVSMDYLGRLKKHKAKDTPPRINTVPRVGVLKSITNTGLTEDQIALTLAVCADAKIDVRKTKNNYAHFGFVKERKVSRLKGILDRLSLAYVENISDKHTYISFTLPDFIKGKELPPSWISTSTQEERLFIIDELVHWDGNSVPNRNQVEFSSKHYEEAKWVQTIAHVSGFCSSIIERSNDLGTWYKVSVLFGKKHSSWQSMKTETIPYDGNVHCVTVPTGMIMVRINDHISISGNCDALALYQVLTSLSTLDHYDPAVVSLSHGSASAAKDISQDYDYVNSFDKIVLCFDMDEAGQRAVDDACKILAGKVYVAKYSEKDANDMLLKGKAEELKWDVLKHAKQYMPDNIVNYNDCWDRYKNARNQQCYPFPDGWPKINEKTYGVRLGELVMVSSGCVDKDTEFMTPLGWKKISEYNGKDKVLQYHEGGDTSFTTPRDYINLPCDKMYNIHTKYGISQTLSDEHRVVYFTESSDQVKVKTLKEVREVHDKQSTGFRGKIQTTFNPPSMPGVPLSEEEIRIQVAVNADGHLHGKRAVLRIKKQRKKDRIRELLTSANIEWLETDCKTVPGFTRFNFIPPVMEKRYTSIWYACNKQQLRTVADEVLFWDGNQRNMFFTTHVEDADFIQYCFSSLGKRASLKSVLRDGRKSTDYTVTVSENPLVSFRKTLTSSPEFKEVVPEDGRKYCFTVETGMLVLRKDGNIFVTGNSGSGKTQFLRELKDHYHRTTDFKFGDIALEEDVGDSMAGMMSLYLNKRITLPDVEATEDEEKEAFDFYFKDNRWTGYDYFGGLDDDNLFSKIRFLAATGHKFIYLDHLSIIVSEYAAEGGERERIDTIMTKLAKMVKELNITIFLIVHLKKTSGTTSFEEGATPSLDDLRGSASLKQLSWTVIGLSRNQQHENSMCANTSKITVLKCRFTGRTGTADYLYFNQNSGRMVPVSKPEGYEANKGGNKDGGYRQQAF